MPFHHVKCRQMIKIKGLRRTCTVNVRFSPGTTALQSWAEVVWKVEKSQVLVPQLIDFRSTSINCSLSMLEYHPTIASQRVHMLKNQLIRVVCRKFTIIHAT